MLRNVSALLLSSTLLVGCSLSQLSGALGALGGGDSYAVDAQVGGKRQNAVSFGDRVTGDITAEQDVVITSSKTEGAKVESAREVTVYGDNPWLLFGLVILAVVGWFLPDPITMMKHKRKGI